MNPFDRFKHKLAMPAKDKALKGRQEAILPRAPHFVLGNSLLPDYPEGTQRALFGMGCFWGAERLFWQQNGVHVTAVGYGAGYTPNPTYEEVCSGQTGHNELVLVVYYPQQISFWNLLKLFWEHHNPTQGMRQGNDLGTQYRSGIYCFNAQQMEEALHSRAEYQQKLSEKAAAEISTEILEAGTFYFAEEYHQQYLAKNPGGYCNLQSTDRTGFPQL